MQQAMPRAAFRPQDGGAVGRAAWARLLKPRSGETAAAAGLQPAGLQPAHLQPDRVEERPLRPAGPAALGKEPAHKWTTLARTTWERMAGPERARAGARRPRRRRREVQRVRVPGPWAAMPCAMTTRRQWPLSATIPSPHSVSRHRRILRHWPAPPPLPFPARFGQWQRFLPRAAPREGVRRRPELRRPPWWPAARRIRKPRIVARRLPQFRLAGRSRLPRQAPRAERRQLPDR